METKEESVEIVEAARARRAGGGGRGDGFRMRERERERARAGWRDCVVGGKRGTGGGAPRPGDARRGRVGVVAERRVREGERARVGGGEAGRRARAGEDGRFRGDEDCLRGEEVRF